MYRMNRGLKEWSLDPGAFLPELNARMKEFDIKRDIRFYSQQDEDKYIIQYLLKNKITNGTFLEIGACDGVLYSNTKTLEDFFGFSGILIEPQPAFYNNLIKNRPNCECYNYAVSDSSLPFVEFIGNNAEGGITESMNVDKYPHWKSYEVPNIWMKDILAKSRFKYVDFMIIDVEGGELPLLKSIDFTFPIGCIIIEAHSGEQEKNRIFGEYLLAHGFTYKERQRGNEVWINHSYFRKELFNF